jgi:hypothetical protein
VTILELVIIKLKMGADGYWRQYDHPAVISRTAESILYVQHEVSISN